MNTQNKAPCAAWAEKLALLHPDDLSPAERAAQEEHVASCPACSSVRMQYAEIAALLRDLPVDDVPEELPPRLVGLWEEEEKRQQTRSPVLISAQQAPPIPPKRNRPVRRVALLSVAVLVVAVVLGSLLVHLVSVPYGNQSRAGGPGPSPGRFFIIHQSVIYVTSGSGKLLSLRGDNGELIRSYTIGVGRILKWPVVVGDILYDSDSTTLYALRVRDGSVVWHTTFGDHQTILFLYSADGIIYVSIYDGNNQIYALRASNGRVLWRYQALGVHEQVGRMVVVNGIMYIGSSDWNAQHLYALNVKNGALLWSHQFSEENGPELLVNAGEIFFFAGNGIFALRADSGTLLWTHHVDDTRFLQTPVIAGNLLYTLGDNGYVYALHLENGKLQWSSKIAEYASSESPLLLVNGMIIVASFGGLNPAGSNPKTAGGNLYALRPDNGRIIWQKNFGPNDIPIMAVDHGVVYVTSAASLDETLQAVRPGDGSIVWRKSLKGL